MHPLRCGQVAQYRIALGADRLGFYSSSVTCRYVILSNVTSLVTSSVKWRWELPTPGLSGALTQDHEIWRSSGHSVVSASSTTWKWPANKSMAARHDFDGHLLNHMEYVMSYRQSDFPWERGRTKQMVAFLIHILCPLFAFCRRSLMGSWERRLWPKHSMSWGGRALGRSRSTSTWIYQWVWQGHCRVATRTDGIRLLWYSQLLSWRQTLGPCVRWRCMCKC